jgi:hypothetical protein
MTSRSSFGSGPNASTRRSSSVARRATAMITASLVLGQFLVLRSVRRYRSPFSLSPESSSRRAPFVESFENLRPASWTFGQCRRRRSRVATSWSSPAGGAGWSGAYAGAPDRATANASRRRSVSAISASIGADHVDPVLRRLQRRQVRADVRAALPGPSCSSSMRIASFVCTPYTGICGPRGAARPM